MAETRLSDCPKCGRANVIGYRNDGIQYAEGGGGAYGAIVGGLLGGPIGIGIGAWLGKKAGELIANSGGEAEYKFKCPNFSCGHTWTKYFPNVK